MTGKIVSGYVRARLQQRGLEALGSPGRGLGCHWGSEAGEVFRAAHVGGLEGDGRKRVVGKNRKYNTQLSQQGEARAHHLLIASGPGSLPHHEAFGWAAMFIH